MQQSLFDIYDILTAMRIPDKSIQEMKKHKVLFLFDGVDEIQNRSNILN